MKNKKKIPVENGNSDRNKEANKFRWWNWKKFAKKNNQLRDKK